MNIVKRFSQVRRMDGVFGDCLELLSRSGFFDGLQVGGTTANGSNFCTGVALRWKSLSRDDV